MNLLSLSKSYLDKKISPKELVQNTINKIKRDNPTYNVFITLCEEEAITAAQLAEEEMRKGINKGPLHGIPVAIKDVVFTKGIRTTMGSKVNENFVPDYDATVVEKLKAAGAIIVGKVHTHEFAYGPTGDRSAFGPCRNPYNINKITGGSSSGSAAAVALNMAYATIGTDTGGSIRIPASACGVVGMKPTFGLVSKYGIHNTAYTMDHPGPMTKTVYDNAVMLNVLAGFDERDPDSLKTEKEDYTRLIGKSVAKKIIGLPTYFYKNIDDEVANAIKLVTKVYEKLGAQVKEVRIDEIDTISQYQVFTIQAEAYAVHEEKLRYHSSKYDKELFERLDSSKNLPAYQYVIAQQNRLELTERFNKIFEDVDVLLTPTLPILPTNIDQREVTIGQYKESVRNALLKFTSPVNYTGNPALNVPCSYSRNGLPIGFQLIGKHGDEAQLYQFGYAYENNKE